MQTSEDCGEKGHYQFAASAMPSTYMISSEESFDIESLLQNFELPLLIVSTAVGRGMFSIGEAIEQRYDSKSNVYHIPIEELVGSSVINEDVERYKIICRKCPALLHLVYRIPIFYYRKFLREKLFNTADVQELMEMIDRLKIKSVICISHRPTFWVTNLKRRNHLNVSVWGLVGEYGNNLGWKYQFWEEIDGILSPIDRSEFNVRLPSNVKYFKVHLPARREYYDVSHTKGDKNNVLLTCGMWGLGPMLKVAHRLSSAISGLTIHLMCGENIQAYEHIRQRFVANPRIMVYRTVPSLIPLLEKCASVITKPGISSLLESYAAQRQIFLLKGLPVAEDSNAQFAIRHFGAQWFEVSAFKKWHANQ